MNYFVTGGAGFIGSNLVDRLLQGGHTVVAYDNFSTGHERFLEGAKTSSNFKLVRGDTLDVAVLTKAMRGADFVFHLAANADIRFGTLHPCRDLQQNTIATSNVLEAMRQLGICRIAFASTGSVYGEPRIFPTPEDAPFPVQTSFYGASKLAGEALIQAYCEGFNFTGYIFRFVSILGERYTHGHVFDFYKKLCQNPNELLILGGGYQRKSYLYVQDCIDGMLQGIERSSNMINIYNLGRDDHCDVNESIGWITDHMGLNPKREYTGGVRGWIGDSPFILLDTRKMRERGWTPTVSIKRGVIRTLQYFEDNPWVLEEEK